MPQTDLLKRAASVLDHLGVPYMLTGSMASSFHDQPRATHDIDLVIDRSLDKSESLFAAFPPEEFYVSRTAIEDAIRTRGMFNVLNLNEGDEIDFWMLTDDPFDRSRFARKQEFDVDGVRVAVSSPEDTILMKLKWSQEAGDSQIQLRDARRIDELQADALDLGYLKSWVRALNLSDIWNRLLSEASPG